MARTMIERVAESQAKFDGRTLISMPRFERERYFERGRAAIEAMREPSVEMMEAGNALPTHSAPSDFYAAYIEAALEKET